MRKKIIYKEWSGRKRKLPGFAFSMHWLQFYKMKCISYYLQAIKLFLFDSYGVNIIVREEFKDARPLSNCNIIKSLGIKTWSYVDRKLPQFQQVKFRKPISNQCMLIRIKEEDIGIKRAIYQLIHYNCSESWLNSPIMRIQVKRKKKTSHSEKYL